MSFLPTPFNIPDLVVDQLQNIHQSTPFEGVNTTSPEAIGALFMLLTLPTLTNSTYYDLSVVSGS